MSKMITPHQQRRNSYFFRMSKMLSMAWAATLFWCSLAPAVEISFERDTNLPLIDFNLAVRTGAVADPQGQAGITNFMGEMLLRGTRHNTKEQIDLALDQIGAKLEVETRAESMIFRGAVLSSQMNTFLAILEEILTQPSFPEIEIGKLKKEVISGLLEEQGHDASLASRRFTEFLFNGHPYGKPILGKVKDIEALNGTQIRAHYDRLIRDRLLLIAASGDTSLEQLDRWARKLAATRPGGDEMAVLAAPKASHGRRLLIVDKPDRTQTQILAGQIGVKLDDPNYFPLYLGNHIFGGGSFSSRLMKEIRVKRGWSYGAKSSFRHGLQPRSWNFYFFPAAKDAPAALAEGIRLMEALKKEGVTPEEFQFARDSLINSAGFSYNTPQKRVENTLLEKTLGLPEGFIKSYGPRIQKVRLQDVNRALSEFLKPEELTMTVLATAKDLKDPLMKAAQVSEASTEVVPYTLEPESPPARKN